MRPEPSAAARALTALRQLRERGRAPAHGVYVTDSWKLAELFDELQFATIVVRPAEELDWSPVHGLYVLLLYRDLRDRQVQRQAVAIREALPSRLEAFDFARAEFTTTLPFARGS